MDAVTITGGVFLAVACASMVVHVAALRRLLQLFPLVDGANRLAARGLRRTIVCRVGVAVLYVGVGVNAVFAQWATAVVALAAFTATNVLWQWNSLLDVRLKKRLTRGGSG